MNIIVVGAGGDVGSRVVAEAVRRRHGVTAVVRRPREGQFDSPVAVVQGDVTAMADLSGLIAGHDLVISALRPPEGHEPDLVPLTQAVVNAAQRARTPFVVVGGAASLYVPGTKGHTVLTAPGFLPADVVPIATASQRQYAWCVGALGDLGAYACPPALLAPGERTGRYRLGADTLVVGEDGQSRISMEDFAVALLDEAESRKHTGRRFTVGY